jgi:DNA-binding MarR family transcriptional regulator
VDRSGPNRRRSGRGRPGSPAVRSGEARRRPGPRGAAGPVRVAADHARRYPGADRLATEVFLNLFRAEGLASAALGRALRAHGLSPAAFNVLMILEGAGGPLCPHEIGERRLVTRGTVTGLLDSLERAGLVRRRPHPEDRRRVHVELTPAGRALLARAAPTLFAEEARIAAALPRRDREALVRLLGRLQEALAAEAVRRPGI